MGIVSTLPLQQMEEEENGTHMLWANGKENSTLQWRAKTGLAWNTDIKTNEYKSRDIKENKGMALAKHEGREGIPDIFQAPAAPSPAELWLPPPGSISFSS